jgi:hypothetical protein
LLAIRKDCKWIEQLQLLVYTDNVNILRKNTTLLETTNEIGLELNTERTKYMVISCQPNCRTKSYFPDC